MCGTKEDASGGIVYVYVNDENNHAIRREMIEEMPFDKITVLALV